MLLVRDIAKELAVLPQVAPYSDLFYRFLNAAQRNIFLEGNYVGVLGQYNFLAYTGIIACPFGVEAILAADILNTPINVQNMWFEFLQNGPGHQGPRGNASPNSNLVYPDIYDRGDEWCTIQDPPGPFYVQINCAVPEDPNAFVIVEGLDQNGNVIRTSTNIQMGDGTVQQQWMNGAQIPLYIPGQALSTSTQQFTKVTGIIFPADCNGVSTRNGTVNLYALTVGQNGNIPANTQFLLGIYPYFVQTPTIKRYWFPAAVGLGTTYVPVPVNCLVRRKPLPLSRPTDRMTVDNIEAIKRYFAAAYKMEEEQWDSETTLQAKGKFFLEQEQRKTKSSLDRINVQFRGFGRFPRHPGSL